MNSFFPDAIDSWNIFITHFDDVPSFDILEKHINTFFLPETQSIYGIYDRVGLRYLLQLRGSLNHLRSHKWHHNFTDTPSEMCVVVNKALKIRVILYFHILSMQFKEQP